MNKHDMLGTAAFALALLLAGCKPGGDTAGSTPAASVASGAVSAAQAETTASSAVNGAAAQPASAASAARLAKDSPPLVLSGDAVRDFAKLDNSDLQFPNDAKDLILAKYFDYGPEKADCVKSVAFSQDTFDEICAWSASKDQDFPTMFIAMNTVGPRPNIWSAVVATHAYGPQPLGPVWHCASASNPDLLICTQQSRPKDRPDEVAQWERYFDSVN